jgi:prolipoprotein diacylglyceryl transferase
MNLLLASIPSPSRNVIEIGPLTIHFYGIMIAVGVIVAVLVAKRRYERFGGSGETVERASIWAVVIGFLGARLAYVSTHTGEFLDRPWAMLYIWEGGLALYGGLIAGTIGAVVALRRSRGDVFAFGDAVAVGIPLAQTIGRFGNYFNQELFGTPSNLPWAIEIDPNIAAAAGYPGFETFHPTFLYEALWNVFVTVGVILLLERRGKLYKGSSIALYMILYGTGRFLMELMRTDTTFRFLGLSRNGWVSIGAVLVGAVLLWWMQQRREERTLVGPPVFLAPGAMTVSAALDSNDSASDETPAADVAIDTDVVNDEAADEEPERPPPS